MIIQKGNIVKLTDIIKYKELKDIRILVSYIYPTEKYIDGLLLDGTHAGQTVTAIPIIDVVRI